MTRDELAVMYARLNADHADEEARSAIVKFNRLIGVNTWTAIHRAMRSGDVGYARGWIDATFDVQADPTHVGAIVDEAMLPRWEDPGDWRMWIKKRLEVLGYFPCRGRVDWERFTVELHTGFLYLVEDEEHLENLRRPDRTRDDRRVGPAGYSEPAIERTTRVIHPIDAVALRVAPTE